MKLPVGHCEHERVERRVISLKSPLWLFSSKVSCAWGELCSRRYITPRDNAMRSKPSAVPGYGTTSGCRDGLGAGIHWRSGRILCSVAALRTLREVCERTSEG